MPMTHSKTMPRQVTPIMSPMTIGDGELPLSTLVESVGRVSPEPTTMSDKFVCVVESMPNIKLDDLTSVVDSADEMLADSVELDSIGIELAGVVAVIVVADVEVVGSNRPCLSVEVSYVVLDRIVEVSVDGAEVVVVVVVSSVVVSVDFVLVAVLVVVNSVDETVEVDDDEISGVCIMDGRFVEVCVEVPVVEVEEEVLPDAEVESVEENIGVVFALVELGALEVDAVAEVELVGSVLD